ncbi:hypothetical protein RHMOL_Rhmol05G0180100 [Rhododendron molle]|uniref:Uncharacterized protein n=1 Tax=Rhododendron molle TaxID=49168 RepID=A0ACC0NQL9_RHOML|nr:hypothetical protein RHMOL_Rhmol05G0180100 [Rhododendron molle]
MISGNAKIPSWRSTIALVEPSRELHDFFRLVLNWGFVCNAAGKLPCGLIISSGRQIC